MIPIPVQPIVLSIPSLVYYLVQRKSGMAKREAAARLGLLSARPVYYLYAILLFLLTGAAAFSLLKIARPELAHLKGTNFSNTPLPALSLPGVLVALVYQLVYVAFGEEIFFRGLVAGWLFRKWRFGVANIVQSVLFLLPHLLLLAASVQVWPFLLLILLSGWLLGWLRYRSSSIWPGLLMHTLANTASLIIAAL